MAEFCKAKQFRYGNRSGGGGAFACKSTNTHKSTVRCEVYNICRYVFYYSDPDTTIELSNSSDSSCYVMTASRGGYRLWPEQQRYVLEPFGLQQQKKKKERIQYTLCHIVSALEHPWRRRNCFQILVIGRYGARSSNHSRVHGHHGHCLTLYGHWFMSRLCRATLG